MNSDIRSDAADETPGEGKSPSFARLTWQRLRRDRFAMAGLFVIVALVVVSYLAPVLANNKPIVMRWEGRTYWPALVELFPLNRIVRYPELRSVDYRELRVEKGLSEIRALVPYSPYASSLDEKLQPPSRRHWILFLVLAVIAFLPPSIFNIMVIIGITRWTGIARYTRGEFLRLKNEDFAYAARALGASDRKVIFRHILPNSLAPILVSATFGIAAAILVEAALSFLGLGVQPPTPSWGAMLSDAREFIEVSWWLALFPGLGIFITVTAYNLLGEGLRDASDPRQSLPENR
jgi:peptide/nickel transport system permease protein